MEMHTESDDVPRRARAVTHDQQGFSGIDDRSLTPEYRVRDSSAFAIHLETARDAEIVQTMIEHRIADLGALAKKNSGEGYPTHARVQLGDADVLNRRILPQLTGQLALFREPSFSDALGKLRQRWQLDLERRLTDAARNGEEHGHESNLAKETRLGSAEEFAGALAGELEAFALELYDRAYHAGLSERQGTFHRTSSEALRSFGL